MEPTISLFRDYVTRSYNDENYNFCANYITNWHLYRLCKMIQLTSSSKYEKEELYVLNSFIENMIQMKTIKLYIKRVTNNDLDDLMVQKILDYYIGAAKR